MQRCKDLIEVCECQVLFKRMEDGEQKEMPAFIGQRGPEIARSLVEIESSFDRNLGQLRLVKKTILDVKATSWHDDYNRWVRTLGVLEISSVTV